MAYLTGDAARKEVVRLIETRAGKNSYSQARPGNFWGDPNGGKGVGDCSLTAQQAYLRATGINIGGNTSAMIDNRAKFIMVEDNRSGARSYPTLSKLKPGDLIMYGGNSNHSWNVQHVEITKDQTYCWGHGSGTGPTKHNIKTYSQNRTGSRKYLCTLRPIKDDDKVYKLGDRPLIYGTQGADVSQLQTLLKQLGRDLGNAGIDGDYGPKTRDAVKAEQKYAGLAQTGDADLQTIAAIITHAGGQPPKPVQQTVTIHGGQCFIRSGPGTHYTELGVAKNGASAPASGEVVEGWIGVIYKDKPAWVSSKYGVIGE